MALQAIDSRLDSQGNENFLFSYFAFTLIHLQKSSHDAIITVFILVQKGNGIWVAICLLFFDFHRFKDYEYFEIDASDFNSNAVIEFGTDREKEKWAIIFAGWGSTKTRIAEREKTKDGWDEYKKVADEHSKRQWIRVRLVV